MPKKILFSSSIYIIVFSLVVNVLTEYMSPVLELLADTTHEWPIDFDGNKSLEIEESADSEFEDEPFTLSFNIAVITDGFSIINENILQKNRFEFTPNIYLPPPEQIA